MPITNELFTYGTKSNSNSNYLSPFIQAYSDGRFELLILRADLETAGFQENDSILDLKFFPTTISGVDIKNVKIGIKHTAKTNTVNGVFEPYNTYTEVFNQVTVARSTMVRNVWFTFTFSSPYIWNGIDNILITFMKDNSASNFSGAWQVRTMTSVERIKGFSSNSKVSPFDAETALIVTSQPFTVPSMQLTVADRLNKIVKTYAKIDSTSNISAKPVNSSNYLKASISSSSTAKASPIREFAEGNSTIRKNGLVGYWNAKQGLTATVWDNIAPNKIGSYNATVIGATSTVDGLYFDGVDDSVRIPAISQTDLPSGVITIETWVNIKNDTITYKHVVSGGSIPVFGHDEDKFGTLIAEPYDFNYNNTPAVLNAFHHAVIMMDVNRKIIQISVNGVNEIIDTSKLSDYHWGNHYDWKNIPISISEYIGYTESYYRFQGNMSLLRIYNRALDDDELKVNRDIGYEIGLEAPQSALLPSVSIVNIDKPKISDEVGMNQSVVTVRFDTNVIQYVARLNGSDHTTGTLIHSGGAVLANTDIQVVVDWNELSSEGQNRINIYGQNADGWTPYT